MTDKKQDLFDEDDYKAYAEATKNIDPTMFYTDPEILTDEQGFASLVRSKVPVDTVKPELQKAYLAYIEKNNLKWW